MMFSPQFRNARTAQLLEPELAPVDLEKQSPKMDPSDQNQG